MTDQIKEEIIKLLQTAVGKSTKVVLTTPPRVEMGDFSFPCFELASKKEKNPVELAKEISEKISQVINQSKSLREVQAVGPYVNFFASQEKLVAETLRTQDLGLRTQKKGKVVLDVFQANPLKIFHIGHLFNAVLGESIRRLLEFTGYKTVTYSYSGDVGVHVARWLWYFKNFYHGRVPEHEFNKWAGEIYAESGIEMTKKLKYEKEVNDINQLIDRRDKSIAPLWKKLTQKSYAASWEIAKELGCRVDYSFPESVCEGPGKEFLNSKFQIPNSKIKRNEGALGVDLGEKLGFFILLKSDGTALYQTKDLGLATLRHQKIGQYEKCLFVVGSEQEHYFKQLFKTIEILDHPDKKSEKIHVAHGLVSLKEGKMASRLGNVVSYDELRDETFKKILGEIEKKNPGLKNKKAVAMKVTLAALKFSLLKSDRLKNIKFDWEEALSFEGNSGPYLQYTYARIQAIIKKAKKQKIKPSGAGSGSAGKAKNINYNLLTNIEEVRLVKVLGKFGEKIEQAAAEYQPYVLAQYLLELAAEFNHFYHQCRVVDLEHLAISQARLVLINKVAEVLEQGLALLGIEVVEEM
jgi:arginyl-tRNA synthetase